MPRSGRSYACLLRGVWQLPTGSWSAGTPGAEVGPLKAHCVELSGRLKSLGQENGELTIATPSPETQRMTIIARILRLRPYIACSRMVIIANLNVCDALPSGKETDMLTNNRRLVNNKKYLVIQLDNPASDRIISVPSNDGLFRFRLPLRNR